MARFKVGDRVRVCVDRPWGKVKKGEIGVIVDRRFYRTGEICVVDFPSQSHWHVVESDLELVPFTKADLKTGMVVEIRKGDKFIVMQGIGVEDALVTTEGYLPLTVYSSDLLHSAHEYDIVKVYEPRAAYQLVEHFWDEQKLIWERKECLELTLAEVAAKFGVDTVKIKEGEK